MRFGATDPGRSPVCGCAGGCGGANGPGVSSWASSTGAAAFATIGTQHSQSAIDKTAGAIFMQRMLYLPRRLRMVRPCGMMDAVKISYFP